MASSNVRTQPTPGCVLNEMQQMSPRVMNNCRLRTKTHWTNFLSFPETRGAAAWSGLLGDGNWCLKQSWMQTLPKNDHIIGPGLQRQIGRRA
jgi:hypothetical protein